MDIRKFLGDKREYLPLFAIFLLALALRITTARFDYLLEADPWYHYKIAEIFLKSGEYPMWEYYSRYPFGEAVASPPGLYYMPVYIYKAINFTGISLFEIFQLLPAIFGSLSVLPLYLLAKELYNKKVGFLAALLFALSPAGIERGLAGFYRGDAFMVFTMLFAFYFFMCSIRGLYFAILAMVFVFLSGLFWNAWPFVFAVLSMTSLSEALVNYFRGRPSDKLIISYVITCGFGLLLLFFFNLGFYRYEQYQKETGMFVLGFKILFFVILSIAILDAINRILKEKYRNAKLLLPVIILLAALIMAYKAGYFQLLIERYYRFLQTTKGVALTEVPTQIWQLGIAEQRKATLSYLAYIYTVLLLIAPFGFLLVLREKFRNTFIFVYLFSSLFLLAFQIRFTFLVALAICLLGALPLYYLLIQINWKKFVSLSIVFLLIFSNTYAAAKFASSAEPLVTDDLYEGLTWIRKNTPEDSVILSWWDYTGPILAIADRKTVTHTSPSGIVESTSLMLRTSNETQALGIIKSMNEDFELHDMKVDYILLDFRIYSLWPKILMFEPYVNRPIKVGNRELFDSMLHKLYTKQKLENFKLVFDNKDVRIYESIYSYTRITELETKRYYSKNEEVKISVKTKSNELENVILRINILDPKKNLIFAKEERVGGTSQRDISFTLPEESTRGTYTILAELYSPQMKKVHSMDREFIVID